MDITPYTELKIDPRAVFDTLSERKTRVRFMLPTVDGDWRSVTWGAFATQIRRALRPEGGSFQVAEQHLAHCQGIS